MLFRSRHPSCAYACGDLGYLVEFTCDAERSRQEGSNIKKDDWNVCVRSESVEVFGAIEVSKRLAGATQHVAYGAHDSDEFV